MPKFDMPSRRPPRPDAEAYAAEAEAERVMFERFYGCIDHIYGKLIEVWR